MMPGYGSLEDLAKGRQDLTGGTDADAVVKIEKLEGGGVVVLRMDAGENRFNPTMLAGLESALDEAEAGEGPLAMVLTGEGKFFSNGLDLDWLGDADGAGRRQCLASGSIRSFARLLEYPGPVVSAVNGHAFGAGAMLALACDWRAMRADRGFFCLPEVDIGLVFVPGMNSLITQKLSGHAARDSMLTAHRFDGPAAEAAGIVDSTSPGEVVVDAAIELVEPLAAKAGAIFGGIKRGINEASIESLLVEARTARGD